MESLKEETTTRYTICFDLFSESDLFDANTNTAETYLQTLIAKNILKVSNQLYSSSWIEKVWERKDIFYPRDPEIETRNILLDNWSDKIKLLTKQLSDNQRIDYRFSAIEITPIDLLNKQEMSELPSTFLSTNKFANKTLSRSFSNDNLCAEVLGFGVVRLFKDSESHINPFKIDSPDLKHVSGDETTVAILSVPFYFSASDLLLGFFDEDDVLKFSHIRLIKSMSPNRFMILLKFREKDDVKSFMRKYQGRKFNSFEPETCSVVEVKEIVFRPKPQTDSNVLVALPYLLEDPFTNDNDQITKKSTSKKYTELATCPVCLDRLDSTVTGLLTIPCQHTFHCSCLSKWKDDTCPVCRYSSRISSQKNMDNFSSLSLLDNDNNGILDTDEKCMVCGLQEHLWICLICGNVGCGRYDGQHAIHHWEETGHCFSMETNTQRVWDYAADGYVHRLVQNEADGKLVELPLRNDSTKKNDEKVEKIGFEYSKILISQLESQREFYENRIVELNSELSFQKEAREKFNDKLNKLEKTCKELETFYITKSAKIDSAMSSLEKLYSEECALNDGLSMKITAVEEENKQLVLEKEELQEQVTDLMFFLESQEKFKNASDDVKEGQVVMVPKKTTKSKKFKKR